MALSLEIGRHIARTGETKDSVQAQINQFLKESPPGSTLDLSQPEKNQEPKIEHLKVNFDEFVSKIVEEEIAKKSERPPVIAVRKPLTLRAGVSSLLHVLAK